MGGEGRELDMQDIERAKEIISVHDPRYLNPDQMATLAANQGDINLIIMDLPA